MPSRLALELRQTLHPYMFVLKQGEGIKDDMMDFSLSIWLVTCQETLRSPTSLKFSNSNRHLLKPE